MLNRIGIFSSNAVVRSVDHTIRIVLRSLSQADRYIPKGLLLRHLDTYSDDTESEAMNTVGLSTANNIEFEENLKFIHINPDLTELQKN